VARYGLGAAMLRTQIERSQGPEIMTPLMLGHGDIACDGIH